MKSLPFLVFFILFAIVSTTKVEAQRPSMSKEKFKQMRDSMLQVRKKMNFENAIKRFDQLKSNNRKDTVKVLDLSDLQLNEFPELVFQFPNVTKLDISNNQILKIPKELADFDSLKVLIWTNSDFGKTELEGNQLVKKIRIPKKTSVEKLYFSDNQLVALPKSIKKLKKLEVLDIGDNEISSDQGRLKKLKNLKTLNFDGNPISISEMRFDKLPGSIEILKLNKCNLTEITDKIYDLQIKDLQLRENKITAIPAGISKMKSLRKLSFYKNKLESLPDDIYELRKLEALDLYYNKLNEVSPRIADFDSLSILYLAHNKLYDVPSEIGEMSQLRELYLHHNQINSLPESFGGLSSIRTLRLNDNIIPEFPEAILKMNKLEFLDISGNLLETLPNALGGLQNLKLFTYDKNQIDFEAVSNKHVAPMVSDMVERGVVCDPTVSKSYVRESN
ncbi:MAG: leucine-rich repeat domain-containing protein [Bacteroidota bacterium]